MDLTMERNTNVEQDEQAMLRMLLDRGIADMEGGKELPLEEAFEKITELRNVGRNARV